MGLLDRVSGRYGGQGLLVRAEHALKPPAEPSNEKSLLGDVLIDRILRLTPHETTPYTTLSLLKAYFPFKEGLCLWRSDDEYVCYAAIGLESNTVTCPARFFGETQYPELKKIENASTVGLDCLGANSDFWIYPLDIGGDALLIITENPGIPLETADLGYILFAVRQKMLPTTPPPSVGGLTTFLEKAFDHYGRKGVSFLLLNGKISEVNESLKTLISSTGILKRLSDDRLLIVFPLHFDTELIGHRLQKKLGLSVIATFNAMGLEEATRLLASHV